MDQDPDEIKILQMYEASINEARALAQAQSRQ